MAPRRGGGRGAARVLRGAFPSTRRHGDRDQWSGSQKRRRPQEAHRRWRLEPQRRPRRHGLDHPVPMMSMAEQLVQALALLDRKPPARLMILSGPEARGPEDMTRHRRGASLAM